MSKEFKHFVLFMTNTRLKIEIQNLSLNSILWFVFFSFAIEFEIKLKHNKKLSLKIQLHNAQPMIWNFLCARARWASSIEIHIKTTSRSSCVETVS